MNPKHRENSYSNINQPLRILIFNWRDRAHPKAGGAEMYTHRVATAWIEMGHSVTLFCSSAPGHSSDEVVDGLRTIRRGSKHSVYRKARHFYLREGRGQYDLVIDEVNTRPFLAPKWVNDVPVVAVIHQVCREIWFYEYRLPIALVGRFILEPWWLRAYRDVPTITLSQSSLESLKMYGLNDVSVIAVGMDPVDEKSDLKRESAPTVIFLGRLAANKRPGDAIEAFRLLLRSIPTAQMWVLGTGPLERQLRKTAPLGVEFLGRTSEEEKRNRLARAHVIIVTSVREGWGLVVTEAAQYGTVAIGYDIPGLRDSIAASNGILVKPTPLALSEALRESFSEGTGIQTRNIQAGGVATWNETAKSIIDTVMKLLGGHRE